MEPSTSDCFSFAKQEFAIGVTIHKIRNLCVFNADTYVKVTLGRKSKRTRVFQNSENPFFNEYFLFDLFCSVPELLRLTMLFEVYKKSCCKKDKCLGQLPVDLASVWSQTGRSLFKKWGKLEAPLGQVEMDRGHIQLDLCITSRDTPPALLDQQTGDFDEIERNLLTPNQNSHEAGSALYVFNIYKGTFFKKADYAIEVCFAGINGKSKNSQNTMNPEWNQKITFHWFYPSLCNQLLVRLLVNDLFQWKCICDYEINLDDITIPGHLPTLGPTYLHLYNPLSPVDYIGRILVAIECQATEKFGNKRETVVSNLSALNENEFWNTEEFCISSLIWAGDYLHVNECSNVKFTVQCGEYVSNTLTSYVHNYDSNKLKYFIQEPPHRVLLLKGFLPDLRLKYEADKFLMEFSQVVKLHMDTFKAFQLKYSGMYSAHAKCLKALISQFANELSKIKNRIVYRGSRKQTLWEIQRAKYYAEKIETLLADFEVYRSQLQDGNKNLSELIELISSQLIATIRSIQADVMRRVQDLWPDVIIHLFVNEKIIGQSKVRAEDFFYSAREESRGRFCGERRNFIFKPTVCPHSCKSCGCIFGKIDGWIWISTESERRQAPNTVNGWSQEQHHYYRVVNETCFSCNVYIHQGKIRPGSDRTGLSDPKVRVTFMNITHETKYIKQTLSPLWNEKITFENLELPGSVQSYIRNPPLIIVELFDVDTKNKSDYLGCALIVPGVQALSQHDRVVEMTPSSEFNLMNMVDNKDETIEGRRTSITSTRRPSKRRKSLSFAPRLQNIVRTRVIMQEFDAMKNQFPTPLKWVPVSAQGAVLAEILVSAELIELEPVRTRKDSTSEILVTRVTELPPEICPLMVKYRVEVLFAGIRNYRKMPGSVSGRFKMSLMLGDLVLYSGLASLKLPEGVMFSEPLAIGVVYLPEEHLYWPQIVFVHIHDTKSKDYRTVGAAALNNSTKYIKQGEASCQNNTPEVKDVFPGIEKSDETQPLIQRKGARSSSVLEAIKSSKLFLALKKGTVKHDNMEMATYRGDEDDFNWWTKFYNSLPESNVDGSEENRKHRLIVYGSELEAQPEFSFLQDWAESIAMTQGLITRPNQPPREETYCTLKYHVEIKKCARTDSGYNAKQEPVANEAVPAKRQQEISTLLQETPVVVRVYIVQGLRIRPVDKTSDSDPYVRLQLGTQKISDRANYIPNQTNPVFGKTFQLEGVIPREHILHISIYDHNCCDRLIGCTCIDLEDRVRSKHRATVGIADEYSKSGYNVWRDYHKPYEILKGICKRHSLEGPELIGNKMRVADMTFEDSTEIAKDEKLQERLSLSVLKKLEQIPEIGYNIVPEHVETRSLYRPSRPGIEQGKLQMWVEIYNQGYVPPPIDITPTPHRHYELRVIIWNTADVILEEKNVFGKSMSDIYVKGWLDDIETAQYTDVHYRSLTGEGNFNWRMIFPIKYSKVEDTMVTVKKGFYGHRDTEIKLPPIFNAQIWDNDTFSPDDFLGVASINLSHFPEPFSSAKSCTMTQPKEKQRKHINLFKQKTTRGWFPVRGKLKDGSTGMTGKIEMELEILNEAEAAARPAGIGRDGPDPLAAPNRPKSSFKWFSNPLLSFKHILKPVLKKYCLYVSVGLIVIIIVFAIIYSLPGNLINSIF